MAGLVLHICISKAISAPGFLRLGIMEQLLGGSSINW
jgi:hypothetical protein